MKLSLKKFGLFALTAAVFLFVGCEESIKNSTIPSKYATAAQKFSGYYSGHFEGLPVKLKIQVAASGLVTATLDSSLLTNCETRIGALIGVSGNKNSQTLEGVRFALNTDNCGIEGQDLYLSVSKNGAIGMQVVESSETSRSWVCLGVGADRDCDWGDFTTYKYLNGNLNKVN